MAKFFTFILVLLSLTIAGCDRPFEQEHWMADFTPRPDSFKDACTNPPCSRELACPILPDNCATTSTHVPMSWTIALVSNVYRVQISGNPSFTAIQQDILVFGGTNFTATVPLGVHYWRVVTCDEAGNALAYSPGRSFSVITIEEE